ncbi:putative serine esterase (DUF676) [Leishmania shawi]
MNAGVLACAHRVVNHVCAVVSAVVTRELSIDDMQCSAAAKETALAANDAPTAARRELHFSAVGHSMGGLILRAALPFLIDRIEGTYGEQSLGFAVHWDVFCTLATPHLGVKNMMSNTKMFLGQHIGCYLSTAIADLFCKSSVVSADLVSRDSLAAWARFKRRVLLSVVNDETVLMHSSSFVMPLHILKRVGAPLPTAEADLTDACSKTNAGTHHRQADCSALHLARLGIMCASSLEELRGNGVLLTEISPDLWPPGVLPEERALAEHILRDVGPLELHVVDFRPRLARLTSRDASHGRHGGDVALKPGIVARGMMMLGVNRFSHSALLCKWPFSYPSLFGFVLEYVASDLILTPLSSAVPVPTPQEALQHRSATSSGSPTVADSGEGMASAAEIASPAL